MSLSEGDKYYKARLILEDGSKDGVLELRAGDKPPFRPTELWRNIVDTAAIFLPDWTAAALRSSLAVCVALFILNQKHLLPKPLSAFVSKAFFWPSLPFTVVKRLGTWSTVIDDTVVMGGVPLGFVQLPERLYNEHGVRGVVNLCQEYKGPENHYKRLGMRHLRLPTVDHFEPTLVDLERAVAFIQKHHEQGTKVYVHCKAGHGRSAAVVFAWLVFKDPKADLKELNREFCLLRNVRKTLWKQKNILAFQSRLQSGDIELTELDKVDEDGESDKEL